MLSELILNLHYYSIVRDSIRIHEATEIWKWKKDTLKEEVKHFYAVQRNTSFGPFWA